MKYLALYRKYRPKTFDEVSGQQVIIQTLKNIIKNNKVTHSYLFVGPRGTGKTSIAKIFAKTINCEKPENGCSCENCNSCKLSNEENIDIIEMDAASNNGVDEIREIREHVTLLPTNSKYKIYIIDEVHMLTTGAFNALLKTLEEPPEHVIFILATTEPHKIPLTIKSRCQSFEFKLIPRKIIVDRLKFICEKENIEYDEGSLELIANNSNGGLRDAVGMLDQVNSYTDGNITVDDILMLNGRISDSELEYLFECILNEKYDECFFKIDEIESYGKEFTYICEDMIKYLKDILTKNKTDLFKEKSNDEILEMIKILNDSMKQIMTTMDKRIYFDLAILKLFNLKQTNVCNNQIESSPKIEKKPVKKEEEKIVKSEKVIDEEKYDILDRLMDIRLNNILSKANKLSLAECNKLKENSDVLNLDDLKTINLLNDGDIRAASNDGIVISVDNKNILFEMYDNLEKIEEYISKTLNKSKKICILLDDEWNDKREVYIKKIKNKEKIEIISEDDIIKELEKISSKNKSEFEDLLEIGE